MSSLVMKAEDNLLTQFGSIAR